MKQSRRQGDYKMLSMLFNRRSSLFLCLLVGLLGIFPHTFAAGKKASYLAIKEVVVEEVTPASRAAEEARKERDQERDVKNLTAWKGESLSESPNSVVDEEGVERHPKTSDKNLFKRGEEPEGLLSLQIQSQVIMSDEQEQMLRNGIPLTFVYEVRLTDHKGFFSKLVDSQEIRLLLFYHGLSKQFVVRDLAKEKQDSYPTLSLALLHISTLENIELKYRQDNQSDYQGKARLWVDIEALPTPLRIPAYLSSKWQLNSGWHSWGLPL